jgi:hypothetical protein
MRYHDYNINGDCWIFNVTLGLIVFVATPFVLAIMAVVILTIICAIGTTLAAVFMAAVGCGG